MRNTKSMISTTLCGRRVLPIGLGTYKSEGLSDALDIGYRLIDCAAAYHNQHLIGPQLKSVPREDLFIVSKVWPTALAKGCPLKSVRQTLRELQVEYLDLLLIHWPIVFKESEEDFPLDASGQVIIDEETSLESVWREVLELRDCGLTKSVGVSNFNSSQITQLECLERPVVLQMEAHPLLNNQQLLDFCLSRNIGVMAFCPLARGKALQLPVIQRLAEKHSVTPAQVCLRWGVQRGTVVIPKSSSHARLQENFNVFGFELSAQDMQDINGCNTGYRISLFDKFGASRAQNWPFRQPF